MHDVPRTEPEGAEATLKRLGLRPVCVEESAIHLNGRGIRDPRGNPWTPDTLASCLDEHHIRPEVLPDLSHFVFGPNCGWNAHAILRAIERGPDDSEVCRQVIHVCSIINDTSSTTVPTNPVSTGSGWSLPANTKGSPDRFGVWTTLGRQCCAQGMGCEIDVLAFATVL